MHPWPFVPQVRGPLLWMLKPASFGQVEWQWVQTMAVGERVFSNLELVVVSDELQLDPL